jgi:hypothetical protein
VVRLWAKSELSLLHSSRRFSFRLSLFALSAGSGLLYCFFVAPSLQRGALIRPQARLMHYTNRL